MRAIDVAAATSFALLSLTLIAVMSPATLQTDEAGLGAQAGASDAILSYLGGHDLAFLAGASLGQICESLPNGTGNGSFTLDVVVNGVGCGAAGDGAHPGYASVTLSLPGRTVEVEAWRSPGR